MKEYSAKQIILKKNGNGGHEVFLLETFSESKKLENVKISLLKNVDIFIQKNWGQFSKDFIIHHIVNSDKLKILRRKNIIVAFAAASIQKISGREILYLEFTAVNEEYRGYNISTILNAQFIVEEFLGGILKRKLRSLDVITITRNLRVIGSLSKFAPYIYPDPKQFSRHGILRPAKEETWAIANEILSKSWDPTRGLLREGLVLLGSYSKTPWLILPTVERYYKKSVRDMGEYYLHFKKNADREFIVHAKVSIVVLIKYFFWLFISNK